MRQLMVQVPPRHGDCVAGIAGSHDAVNVARLQGTDAGGQDIALVILHLSNVRAGDLIGELESVPALRVSMLPAGA